MNDKDYLPSVCISMVSPWFSVHCLDFLLPKVSNSSSLGQFVLNTSYTIAFFQYAFVLGPLTILNIALASFTIEAEVISNGFMFFYCFVDSFIVWSSSFWVKHVTCIKPPDTYKFIDR